MTKRNYFPTLKLNKQNTYLDNAATSLKTNSVIKAVVNYYKKFSLNPHSFSDNKFHQEVKGVIESTKELISKWLNCQSTEVVFTPSTTYALNVLALSFSSLLTKDSRIITTKLEHNSNLYPWIAACKNKKASLEYFALDSNFSIGLDKVHDIIDENVKVVAFSHISNNIGSINNVSEISKVIKKKNPSCLIVVDVCQSIAHERIDLKEWNVDAVVFSAHKVYGPTGIGVLWLRKGLLSLVSDLLWGGGKEKSPIDYEGNFNEIVPMKFEVGTLPLAQIFGLHEVFVFLMSLNFERERVKEIALKKYAVKRLNEIDKVVIYNQHIKTSILLFNVRGIHSHDVVNYLARNGVFVRGGNFCTHYLKELIGISSAVRVSIAIYNRKSDIDRLIDCLKEISVCKLI